MTWLEFARIVKRALEYFRAFLSELQPIEKSKKEPNKPGPVKKKKEYGPPKVDRDR